MEAGSVCEEREDRRLFGGCFLVEITLLSEEGDSGTKLQHKRKKSEAAGCMNKHTCHYVLYHTYLECNHDVPHTQDRICSRTDYTVLELVCGLSHRDNARMLK